VAALAPYRLAAATGFHTALLTSGAGLAWGERTGALGSGSLLAGSQARSVDVQATQLATGSVYTVAAGRDGRAYGWGEWQPDGTLGNFAFNVTTPVARPVALPGLDEVVQVAAAGGYDANNVQYAFALRADGTVWHWPGTVQLDRSNAFDVRATVAPRQVAGLTGVVAFSRGGRPVAIKADGSVWALSIVRNLAGDLATHIATASAVPGLSDVVQASCGDETCLALTGTRQVLAWGDNRFGQLGSGSTAPSAVPVQVSGLGDVVAVSFGQQTSCALTSAGRVWYWGIHPGNGNLPLVLAPTVLSTIDGLVEIDSCTRAMLRSDGTLWGLGFKNAGELAGGAAPGGLLQPTLAPGIRLD